MTERYVVICTEKRGVFGGVLLEGDGPGPVVLKDARMCVYWDRLTKGVPGLAARGPGKGCRVSPAAPRLEDTATAIMDTTPVARKRWESEPWG